MSKKEKVLILIVFIVAVVPIVINEIKIRPKLNLINDVRKILKNMDNYELNDDGVAEEYIIDNGYTIHGDKYDVKGTGVIFLDKSNSVFLNRNGMCAMKVPYSEDIMIQYEECPVYRMFNGIKTPIVNNDSGLYKEKDNYIYKGNDLSNYIMYNNQLWNIVSFSDGNIKLIKSNYDTIKYNSIEDLYTKLNDKYSDFLDNDLLINNSWNIENINLDDVNFIKTEKTINSKIGLLSTSDYLGSLLTDYKIEDNTIVINESSYLTREMVLSTNNAYLNKNNSVYIYSTKNVEKVYPVIILSKNAVVTSGTGTKKDPYILKEAK
jgi:hypothetical protein